MVILESDIKARQYRKASRQCPILKLVATQKKINYKSNGVKADRSWLQWGERVSGTWIQARLWRKTRFNSLFTSLFSIYQISFRCQKLYYLTGWLFPQYSILQGIIYPPFPVVKLRLTTFICLRSRHMIKHWQWSPPFPWPQ